MAGMLAGVECARRRRFHQGGGWSDSAGSAAHSSRRSSFCLYTSNHETHHSSISSLQRIIMNQEQENEKLGGVAREAKQRLDERLLKRHRKSEPKRVKSKGEKVRYADGRCVVGGELQTEVYGSKKGGSKRFSWSKLSWKAMDQEECAICLDRFKFGETLVHLPCAHRFHCRCLVPWLENNALCPCCRFEIVTY